MGSFGKRTIRSESPRSYPGKSETSDRKNVENQLNQKYEYLIKLAERVSEN